MGARFAKHRCKCGAFKAAGERWVVINRREPPRSSQLKCLECGWVWWSRRRYVAMLRDHFVRSRARASDDDVIERLRAGNLIVDSERAIVKSLSRGQWRTLRVIERESNGSTYRFVEIWSGGSKRKKVALHRLVWMAVNLMAVPEGYDVDHVHGKGVKNPDGIGNLRLLESSRNRSRKRPPCSPELPFDEGF